MCGEYPMISAALSAVSASGKYRSRFSTWVRKSPLHSSAMVTKHSPMSTASIGRLLLITTVCLVGLALKIPTGISFRLSVLTILTIFDIFQNILQNTCFFYALVLTIFEQYGKIVSQKNKHSSSESHWGFVVGHATGLHVRG